MGLLIAPIIDSAARLVDSCFFFVSPHHPPFPRFHLPVRERLRQTWLVAGDSDPCEPPGDLYPASGMLHHAAEALHARRRMRFRHRFSAADGEEGSTPLCQCLRKGTEAALLAAFYIVHEWPAVLHDAYKAGPYCGETVLHMVRFGAEPSSCHTWY